MRTIILAATAVLALAGSASAQMINSPGKFCLRTNGNDANKGMETCAYQTMAQCDAVKAGQSDLCVPNPVMKDTAATTGSGSSKPMARSASKSMGSASKSTTGAAPKQ